MNNQDQPFKIHPNTSLAHLELTVSDMASMLAFYGGLMGFQLIETQGGQARFSPTGRPPALVTLSERKDARAQALPLLGGEDTLHDWNYILGRLSLLRWDQAVGNGVYTVGLVALAASVLWGFSCSREGEPSA